MTPEVTIHQLAPIISVIDEERKRWQRRGESLNRQGLVSAAEIAYGKEQAIDRVLARVIHVATGGEEVAA